jgi:DNA-binding CsgD family transcriptional regulator/tetratricopeptide (TPR) repeat protein
VCFHNRVLLERDALLASLEANLVEAVGGNGRLVFVGGEAGVGKTALTGEFARTARGVRVLRGATDSPPVSAPLGPFQEAMAAQVTAIADPLSTRVKVFRAVRSALAETPTLLVLEDLHWADEATLDLLGYLGRRLDTVPALIVATFRDDEVSGSHPLTVVLGDLASRAGVARMHVPRLTLRAVRRLADDAGSHLDVDELYRRTAGNSFYVSEVLASGSASLPPSVRDAALARAARLSPPARRVLDAAAVIGGGVELDLLREVSGQPPDAIDECQERGILVGAGVGLEFRNELARQAIEQALPAAARAGLHAATLAWLNEAGSPDDRRLAHHAEACADAQAVLVHAPKAGDRAARLGAHRDAAGHYRAALRHGDLLAAAERASLLERLSYECYLIDQPQAAADAQAEALLLHRAGDDAVRVGAALRRLSRLSWFLGRNVDSERYAVEALTTLEQFEAGPELAMAYSNLAQLRMLSDDTSEALLWGRKAIELARALGDRAVESHALNNVGAALTGAGQLAEGAAQLGRSLDIALAIDAHEHVARAYTNLGSVYVTHRRFGDADRHLRAGIAYCLGRDLESWRLYMSAWLARSLAEQGRWDAARHAARDVLRHPLVSPITRMPALVVAAQIAIRRGEPGAESAVDEALTLAQPTGETQRIIPVVAARAEAAWTAGRDIAAELAPARDLANGNPWDIGELAWWTRRAGLTGAVPRTCARPFALMLAGRPAEAATAWAAVGSPLWQALALTDSDDATEIRDGVEMLRTLGVEATVQAVLRDLRARGKALPRGPRATSRANPAGLTDRELEVLTLLTAGMSNADIAARLYLSQKTAGHHVSAVLRKLGEPTRSRAVAAAVRRGIVAN